MSEKDKKTPADAGVPQPPTQLKPGQKIAQVTWFTTHEPLMNPGLLSIKTYQMGNPNMNGAKKFFWPVGADFIYSVLEDGTWAIASIVAFKSFNAKVV